MSININIPKLNSLKPKISVFGVGGAGGNALNNMIKSNLEGVEFIAANTDAQSLANSLADTKIQLGAELTGGLGAGSFPDKGRAAAEDQRNIACLFRGLFLLPYDLHRASSAGRWRQKYSHAVHSRVTLAHTYDSTLARRSRLPHLFANQSHRQSGYWTPTTMFSAATQVTQQFSG